MREMGLQADSKEQVPLSLAHTGKLAQGALVTLMGKVVASPLRFLVPILLARWLGPGTFGLYSIGWTILGIVEAIAPLGLDQGVVRFSAPQMHPDRAGLRSVLFQSIGVAGLSGIVCGGVFFVGAPWLATQVYGKPGLALVIQLFALAFPAAAVGVVCVAATRISQRMEFAVYVTDLCLPMLNLALVLAMVGLGWGLVGAVTAGVLAFNAAACLAMYFVGRLFPEVRTPDLPWTWMVKKLLAFSLPTSLSGIVVFLIYRVDRLLMGYFRSEGEVGIYQAVVLFSVLFEFVLAAFVSILTPMIVELERHPGQSQLEALYRLCTKWALYLAAPIVLVICFAPREIMRVVFGAPYVGGWLPLVILALGQWLNVAAVAIGPLHVMTGHQNRWLMITAGMLGLDLILCVCLVPVWGATGAAVSTAVSLGGMYVVGTIDVKRVLAIWPYDRRYRKGLLALAVAGLCSAVISSWTLAPLIKVLAVAGVAVAAFGGTLGLLRLDPEDLEFVRLIGARLSWLRRSP
jgi:O-antigen/teichoic acid export membrane protein